jgi:hypothetical protein
MLIAANLTQIKQREWQEKTEGNSPTGPNEDLSATVAKYEQDDGPLTTEQVQQIEESVENKPTVEESILNKHPYLLEPFIHFKDLTPMVAKEEPEHLKEVDNENREENKIIPDQSVVPVVAEASAGTSEVNRQDVATGFTPKPAMETVGIEKTKKTRASKKKVDIEQTTEDKSNSATVEDQVNSMIENNDTTGLESIYKQIVKELAKNNRNKSTHWGPLKTKK